MSQPCGSSVCSTTPPTVGRARQWSAAIAATLMAVVGGAIDVALGRPWSLFLLAPAVVVGGWPTFRAAARALGQRRIDMNVLTATAVVGAAAVGEVIEAAAVVSLFAIGDLLQESATDRTQAAVRGLMELAPRIARVSRGGAESDMPVEQIVVGDTVLVRPGERVPVDGNITDGETTVNEAPITGESVPVVKRPGDPVYAGTLNGAGALYVGVTRTESDTVLARIVERVQSAQAERPPIQRTIDRFARIYTPLVVALAAALAVGPPLAMTALGGGHPSLWTEWLHRSLALLIIACPCALVIATPVAFVAALGSASRAGALIKGGAFLEGLAAVRAMLYDKTGTLTLGTFRVETVTTLDGMPTDSILAVAAAVEVRSEHPLAPAIIAAAAGKDAHAMTVTDFVAMPGLGARAVVDGRTVEVGSGRLAADDRAAREAVLCAESAGATAVVVVVDARPVGVISMTDTVRPEAQPAVSALRRLGIEHHIMLTGDNDSAARRVASAAGMTAYRSGLLPGEKAESVREFSARYRSAAMVGDGVNDAPALASASVGIVMGIAGSDTSIETADVALMRDDLAVLPALVMLGRRTTAIVRQNIAFSLGTKLALEAATVTVGIPLWLAVVGDVGVCLIVTANALRLSGPIGATPRASGVVVEEGSPGNRSELVW